MKKKSNNYFQEWDVQSKSKFNNLLLLIKKVEEVNSKHIVKK